LEKVVSLTIHKKRSPNQDDRIIPVEFLVLHYTAVSLERTLDIFMDTEIGTSAHLVVDRDGSVFEMVDCLNGLPKRARHAGVSQWGNWKHFNDFSIGIELVNFNGNIFEYTEAQYRALKAIIDVLKQCYPSLTHPERVVGHEHIAGYRGKIDPGHCFDWQRLFQDNYPNQSHPERLSTCPEGLVDGFRALAHEQPKEESEQSQFWEVASVKAEKTRA